eukprot:g2455.t1
MDPFLIKSGAPEQVNKENQAGAAAPRKDEGGSSAGAPATAAKPKAKRVKDPAKGVLRLPTPATLRKEAHAADEAIANTDPKTAKKFGKEHVKLMHQLVDMDWHDGEEEQTEALYGYFKAFKKFLQSVFDMAVMDGVAFERCHEVMKALADSWQNMKSIPARNGIEDCFDEDRVEMAGESDLCVKIELGEGKEPLKFASPVDVFARFWPLLLWAAASSSEIEDGLLYRWMKDASDYDADLQRGGALWKLVAGEKEVKNEAGEVTKPAKEPTLRAKKSGMKLTKGLVRLVKLHANRSQWANLDSCKASYKRKRVQVDGPKNRRTRDFDVSDLSGLGSFLFGGRW